LLSNNPLLAVLGVVFLVGAVLLALGTLLIRRESRAEEFVTQEDESDIVQGPGTLLDAVSAFDEPKGASQPRATTSEHGVIPGPSAIAGQALSKDELERRIDYIDRLVMVGQPWCVEELERDFLSDADERVREAAEMALLAVRARPSAG
jgi:hypothetical protein